MVLHTEIEDRLVYMDTFFVYTQHTIPSQKTQLVFPGGRSEAEEIHRLLDGSFHGARMPEPMVGTLHRDQVDGITLSIE